MSETNPGYSDDLPAGEVGSRRATVGTPTDPESINVPPTRPGAAENAHEAEARREAHETFVPEAPEPDDRTDAVRSRSVEEESLSGTSGGGTSGTGGTSAGTGRSPENTTPYQTGAATTGMPVTGHPGHRREPDGGEDEEEQVRASIRETRRELGETVSALAHKADVKSRAADAAVAAKERAGTMAASATAKARAAASEMTGTAKAKASEMTGTAKAKASEMTGTAKAKASEMTGTAGELRAKAYEAAPGQGAKRPVMLVAVAGAVVAVLVRRARRRRRAATSWRAKWSRRA
ncbi:DUF3618 domain-containing protein [Nonomuraea sp. NPDC048826]|uniref:DUF3618 domain-containing protein n=1 Tax=Nonomuraea sp. NPDC048826 TaxID=3364347 RepID=UPI0037243818